MVNIAFNPCRHSYQHASSLSGISYTMLVCTLCGDHLCYPPKEPSAMQIEIVSQQLVKVTDIPIGSFFERDGKIYRRGKCCENLATGVRENYDIESFPLGILCLPKKDFKDTTALAQHRPIDVPVGSVVKLVANEFPVEFLLVLPSAGQYYNLVTKQIQVLSPYEAVYVMKNAVLSIPV